VEWSIARLTPEQRSWLRALDVEHVGDGWMAVHGAPRDPHHFYAYVYELTFRENLDHLAERGLRLCFYGHTHVPFVHRLTSRGEKERVGAKNLTVAGDDVLLVNPGSVGQPRDGDSRASFLLWDRRENRLEFRRVGYRIDLTLRDLERAKLPSDLNYRLMTGR
jgi:diadenosine tetraphosphatase ApaH/serine/threonine PP2A family protein phosphatase